MSQFANKNQENFGLQIGTVILDFSMLQRLLDENTIIYGLLVFEKMFSSRITLLLEITLS